MLFYTLKMLIHSRVSQGLCYEPLIFKVLHFDVALTSKVCLKYRFLFSIIIDYFIDV